MPIRNSLIIAVVLLMAIIAGIGAGFIYVAHFTHITLACHGGIAFNEDSSIVDQSVLVKGAIPTPPPANESVTIVSKTKIKSTPVKPVEVPKK